MAVLEVHLLPDVFVHIPKNLREFDLVVARYLDCNIHRNPWCGDESRNFRASCHPEVFKPVAPIVYHHNRHGTFTDVMAASGFGAHPENGLGIDFSDVDLDGWPDIAIANEARQQLFRNNRDGTLTEAVERTALACDEDGGVYSGTGLSFEDFGHDGHPDVVNGNLANQKYAILCHLQELQRAFRVCDKHHRGCAISEAS